MEGGSISFPASQELCTVGHNYGLGGGGGLVQMSLILSKVSQVFLGQ